MTSVDDFELLRDQEITEFKTRAKLYRHAKTGAEVLSLINDDENKVFGIVFRTPPEDSTGVAHILEHSVLCGSRKYPVKEPFVELIKGSLKTFLNAFTYPDKTCYPVASQNVKDFYNLIDVYLDAVFYPRITPHVFEQEGWHFELEDLSGPLKYKGVVFNEMKGAYSSPDSILAEVSQHSLFPDNTYGLDSGGNPEQIPYLTYDYFKAFHKKYYHPSNARIYFYGNDDPERRLRILSEYLKDFERVEPDSAIGAQPRFDEPRRIVERFAAGKRDEEEGEEEPSKGMVTVNWLLTDRPDAQLSLSLQILEHILLGLPGSPLRKALIDSGLGADLAGVGMETELRQIYFSTGLKDIDPENADRLEKLIVEVLGSLRQDGIDPKAIEAALNTIEFRLRENNTGSQPRGLILMLRALTTWLYDGDPLALLSFEAPLKAVKSAFASNRAYFEDLIDRFLLKNSHRTTVVLIPDSELEEKKEALERDRLATIRKAMSREELEKAVENTLELKRRQEAPDSVEALATIPTLGISDLERKNKTIPLEILETSGIKTLYHDIFTNGILYLDLAFDLHSLPQEYLPYVRLFGRSLVEMGTEREDFVSLAQRIGQKTGGIHPEIFTSAVRGEEKSAAWLFLRAKAMVNQAGDLLDILKDVLISARLDNRERFRQMVHEEKARMERRLVPSGHMVVNQRIRAHFSESDWATEKMQGISYLLFVRKLAHKVEEDWKGVRQVLEDIRELLINRRSMLLNATVDGPGWQRCRGALSEFSDLLPIKRARSIQWKLDRAPAFEGMMIPSLVNYVGKGINVKESSASYSGSALVITGYVRNSWLWDTVRVQGGAYGAMCILDRYSGTLTFVSYRDPNLVKTLARFDQARDFLRSTLLSQKELTKAIIGTIGNIDAYLLPDSRGYVSMARYLRGETEEGLQRMRDEVLSTTEADFRAFADVLDKFRQEGIVKVLGSQSALEQTASENPGWLNLVKVL